MTAPYALGAGEAAAAIRRGELSPVELVRSCLERVERLEPAVQAWELVDAEGALAAARALEARGPAGLAEAGPLAGVPFAAKDIFDTAGMRTAGGFPPFDRRVPERDATAVARLRRAGAILLGKTVTTQFAFADPERTRNPWHPDRTPGGSSSGSGAAVGSGMVPLALGSQTAGSVLRPAAYCGAVGLKPAYGRVSRRGVLPLSWSLDHVGLITRRVPDAALGLQVIAGPDGSDPTTLALPLPGGPGGPGAGAAPPGAPPRLGLVTDLLERSAPGTRAGLEAAVARLTAAGAQVVPLPLFRQLEDILAIHAVIFRAETAAIHLERHRLTPEAFRPRLRAAIEVGQLVPGAAYLQALRWRGVLRREAGAGFAGVDALLMPTAGDAAPDRTTTGDPSFQAPWSLLGLPALTIPCGRDPAGLPLGLQLVAPERREDVLLGVGAWCESRLEALPLPDGAGPGQGA